MPWILPAFSPNSANQGQTIDITRDLSGYAIHDGYYMPGFTPTGISSPTPGVTINTFSWDGTLIHINVSFAYDAPVGYCEFDLAYTLTPPLPGGDPFTNPGTISYTSDFTINASALPPPPAAPTDLSASCQLTYIPTSKFELSETLGVAPLAETLTDLSTGNPDEWLIEWGDGATSNTKNATHTYEAEGIYEIRQTVSNASGSTSSTQNVVVTGSAPIIVPPANSQIIAGNANYYVVDRANNQIKMYDLSGDLLGTFGSFGNGNGEFNGPTTCAIAEGIQTIGRVQLQANPPTGTYLYVVDQGNARIEAFSPAGVYAFQFGTGILDSPYGIVTDGEYLFVTDSGKNKVFVFNLLGQLITSFGSSGSGNGQFDSPEGIALDARGLLYIIDTNNNRFEIFDRSGNFIYAFGSYGSGLENFNHPTDVAVDLSYLYIDDAGNNRIMIYPLSGMTIQNGAMIADQLSLLNDIHGEVIPDLLAEITIVNTGVPAPVLIVSIAIMEGIPDLLLTVNIYPDVPSQYGVNPQKPTGSVQ
jgi:PKD repeat protein